FRPVAQAYDLIIPLKALLLRYDFLEISGELRARTWAHQRQPSVDVPAIIPPNSKDFVENRGTGPAPGGDIEFVGTNSSNSLRFPKRILAALQGFHRLLALSDEFTDHNDAANAVVQFAPGPNLPAQPIDSAVPARKRVFLA